MSELLSEKILGRLRSDADTSSRPKERNGTLDRLYEACNEICSGKARAIIKEGFPDAEVNFRRSPTPIKSSRIEEYVLARRSIDVKARRLPSKWTGPMSTTIRKDKDLREYVQVRAQEQTAASPGKANKCVDKLLDKIDDLPLASEIRFALSKARQSEHDLQRLKEGMRKLRPTFDIEGLISGLMPDDWNARDSSNAPALPAPYMHSVETQSMAVTALLKLKNNIILAKCGLEFSTEFGNLVERKSRFELISSDEFAALLKMTELQN